MKFNFERMKKKKKKIAYSLSFTPGSPLKGEIYGFDNSERQAVE